MEEDPDLFIRPNRAFPNKPRRMRELTSEARRLMDALDTRSRRRARPPAQESCGDSFTGSASCAPTTERLRCSRRVAANERRYRDRLGLHMQLRRRPDASPSPSPSSSTSSSSCSAGPARHSSTPVLEKCCPAPVLTDDLPGCSPAILGEPSQDGGSGDEPSARARSRRKRPKRRRVSETKDRVRMRSLRDRAKTIKRKSDNGATATPNKIIRINLRTNEDSVSTEGARKSKKPKTKKRASKIN